MDFEHFRHYARGWLLHFFGQEEKAFNEYAAAYRLRPDNVQAARNLAFIAARRNSIAAHGTFVNRRRFSRWITIGTAHSGTAHSSAGLRNVKASIDGQRW